jgi:hypothetical protein
MVYARMADKTVSNEYFKVTEKVEALYQQPRQLPATDEGNEMRRLHAEMHRRMLGSGYCARPVEMDCHFDSMRLRHLAGSSAWLRPDGMVRQARRPDGQEQLGVIDEPVHGFASGQSHSLRDDDGHAVAALFHEVPAPDI